MFKEPVNWKDYIALLGRLPKEFTDKDIIYEDSPFFLNKYQYGKRKINYLFEFYAPFNYVNKEAKIVIVGITPGWTQAKAMHKFILSKIREGITNQVFLEKEAKYEASFSGSMRGVLCNWLDEIEINKKLHIQKSAQLFEDEDKNKLLHVTSLLKYPVFIKKDKEFKKYNGHQPKIADITKIENRLESFKQEIQKIRNNPMIIPLGKAASDTIKNFKLISNKSNNRFLDDFQHPSKEKGFEERQKNFKRVLPALKAQVKNWTY